MSSRNLPPVRNLPHWSRIGCLDKPSSLRPLPAKRLLQPLPPPPPPPPPLADRGGGASSPPGDMDPRVASLQRNIHFLQHQHKDTLEKLHAEIDNLRRGNKELQYQLIMHPPKSCRKASTRSQRGTRPPTQGSEACTGLYLEQPLLDTRPSQDQTLSVEDSSNILGSSRQEHDPELRGGLITSLQPLRIQSCSTHPPRAPTLQECEVIIRQLYNANSIQSQEIVRVKAVLRDIVFSKKITPENFILTKAYLADSARKASEVERFPQLAPQTLPKKTSGSSHPGVILPALKQSLSSTIADRQRRTKAVQRNRLKSTVQ
ncbi:coiled-coil domain-containing protein 74B [Diretmus argenteus]